MNVLLVEDDPESLFATGAALEKCGLAVVTCLGADEARRLWREKKFDAVVADVRLKDGDGIQVLDFVKRSDPGIPVILFTGYSDIEYAAAAVRLKADDFFLKPLDNINPLAASIRKAVSHHRLVLQNRELAGAIAEREKILRSVLSSMDDLVFVFDSEGRFGLHCSRSSCGPMHPASKFVGRKHSEVMPPDVDRMFGEAFSRIKTGVSAEYEYSLAMDGKKRHWLAKLSPVFEKDVFAGAVAVVRDITERRMREDELARDKDALRKLTMRLQIAEEEEKERIAVLLHDNMVSQLTLCMRKVDEIARKYPDKELAAEAGLLRELGTAAIDDARSLIDDLAPLSLRKRGLEAALEDLAERMSARYGKRIDFMTAGKPSGLDRQVGILLYRAVAELLVNAIKHAEAGDVAVNLWQDEGDMIRISVEDRGVGFDTCKLADGSNRGFGLISIGERIRNIGGEMTTASLPGWGTLITLTAPVRLSLEENLGDMPAGNGRGRSRNRNGAGKRGCESQKPS